MLASVIPNVSASCATFVPERASSTTCLRTSTGYLLGITSSSLNAGGFQKHNSAKPRSDHFDARFSLAEGEVTEHAKSEEVFTGAAGPRSASGVRVWAPIAHVARDLGIEGETLRKHVRQTEADEGRRKDVLTSQEREEIKALRREVSQLRRANEILKAASVFFAGELDPHRPK
jgi:transposase